MPMDMELLTERAQMLKLLSHPHRLCIVRGLMDNRCNVGQIQRHLGISQSAVSQHLAKLRDAGVIRGMRSGKEVCYEVISPLAASVAELLTSDMKFCEE